jgi:N-acetylneuraminic acid mutarotase
VEFNDGRNILSGAIMSIRRSLDRRFTCTLAFGAFCFALGLGACTRTPPAANADGAAVPAAVENGSAAANAGEMSTHFAGVMPRGLTTVGAATLGDALYLVGGYYGSPHDYSKEFQSGVVSRLSLSTGVWEDLPGVEPIQSPAVIGDGKYLYKLGGLRTLNAAGQPTQLRSVADAARFDTTQNRWEPLPALPEPRSSTYAVVVGKTLYVVGGWKLDGGMYDNTWSETMVTADLSAPTFAWTSVKMPFQIRAHGLTAFGTKIYVVGGLAPESSTDAVHVFDTTTGQWSDGPALPTDNMTARSAVYQDRLYANGADGKIYRLSEDAAKWENVGAVRFARLFHEMVPSPRGPLVLAGIPNNNRGGRIRVIERLSDELAPAGLVMNLASEGPAKNRQGAFLWSQQLFLFGGNNSLGQHDFAADNFVKNATRLDLGALEWRPVPEFPAARQSMQALVTGKDGESALVLGGFGFAGNTLSTHAEVWRHDILKKEWVPAADKALPEGRSQFGVAEWKDAVWVFGGMNFDGSREQDDQIRHTTQILRLDLTKPDGKFEDAGVALKEPRRAFAGSVLEGKYYLVGGLRENFQMVQSCEVLDLEAKTSAALPCPPEHRLGAELVAVGGKLYLVGGSVAQGAGAREHTKRIEVFDPKSQSWSTLAASVPLDTTEQLRAFVYQDQILLFSAQQKDARAQVALLDPRALDAGRQDFVTADVPKPLQ